MAAAERGHQAGLLGCRRLCRPIIRVEEAVQRDLPLVGPGRIVEREAGGIGGLEDMVVVALLGLGRVRRHDGQRGQRPLFVLSLVSCGLSLVRFEV